MKTEIQKIESLFEADQLAIRELNSGLIDEVAYTERNRSNVIQLTDYIAVNGFPFKNKASSKAYFAAFLVVLHSGNTSLMKNVIQIFSSASDAEVDSRDRAYLIDKTRVLEGRPQIYGTQYKKMNSTFKFFPIEDEANVDERRAKMGLSTLAEYRDFVAKEYFK